MPRSPRPTPPAYLLHLALRYDPATGQLFWKPRGDDAAWNLRFADKEAGTFSQGYIRIELLGQRYLAHRLIWRMMTGDEPGQIRHRDGNQCNNRFANLSAPAVTVAPEPVVPKPPTIDVRHGDCLSVLKTFPDNSFDGVVTDAPHHLVTNNPQRQPNKMTGPWKRLQRGFMNQTWDGGDIAFQPATWAEVYRVLKPGGHMCAIGNPRTVHRMAAAIEDAGFEIRDTIMCYFASGFPKAAMSHWIWTSSRDIPTADTVSQWPTATTPTARANRPAIIFRPTSQRARTECNGKAGALP